MRTFLLRFWSRRSDDDSLDDPNPSLHSVEKPPLFTIEETGEIRDSDGDRENRDAPWWDVGALAWIESDSVEEAWKKLEREVTVVEKRGVEIVREDRRSTAPEETMS